MENCTNGNNQPLRARVQVKEKNFFGSFCEFEQWATNAWHRNVERKIQPTKTNDTHLHTDEIPYNNAPKKS